MKNERDMDLIRQILMDIEGGKTFFNVLSPSTAALLMAEAEPGTTDEQAHKLEYHLSLLEEGGLITVSHRGGAGVVVIGSITWAGHDFLDNVRDGEIWSKTKSAAKMVSGASFDLFVSIAKGYVKEKLRSHMGFDLG